jgi:hypothetical protein
VAKQVPVAGVKVLPYQGQHLTGRSRKPTGFLFTEKGPSGGLGGGRPERTIAIYSLANRPMSPDYVA